MGNTKELLSQIFRWPQLLVCSIQSHTEDCPLWTCSSLGPYIHPAWSLPLLSSPVASVQRVTQYLSIDDYGIMMNYYSSTGASLQSLSSPHAVLLNEKVNVIKVTSYYGLIFMTTMDLIMNAQLWTERENTPQFISQEQEIKMATHPPRPLSQWARNVTASLLW